MHVTDDRILVMTFKRTKKTKNTMFMTYIDLYDPRGWRYTPSSVVLYANDVRTRCHFIVPAKVEELW